MYLLACLLENMLKVGIKYVGKRFSHIIYSASILYHSSKISDWFNSEVPIRKIK